MDVFNNKAYFIRAGVLIIPAFLALLAFNKASIFVVIGILALFLAYALFRDLNYWLLVLSLPALTLGEVLYIPVTGDWVYEARLSEIMLLLSGAILFLEPYLTNQWEKLRLDKTGVFLFAYLAWSLMSFAKIIDLRLFVFGMKAIAFSFLGYILAINLIDTKAKQNAFIFGLVSTALILSGQLFYKFYELGFSSRFFFERNLITTPVGPLATVSAILAFLAPIIIGLYFHIETKKVPGTLDRGYLVPFKPFVLVASGIVYVAVFLTLGKGAIASLGLGSFIVFWRAPERRVLFLLAGIWGFILSFYFFNPYLLGLFDRIRNTFVDVSTDFRLREYTTSWSLIRENYGLGVGPGQQMHFFKKMMNLETGNLVNNFFLQSLIDGGVVGLVLVGGLVLVWMGKVKRMMGRTSPCPSPSQGEGTKLSGLALPNDIKSDRTRYFVPSPLEGEGQARPEPRRRDEVRLNNINMLSIGLAGALVAAFFNGLVEVTFYALPYALVFWPTVGSINYLRDGSIVPEGAVEPKCKP